MNSQITSNAFRVLSLPADAETREVYKKQQRLQIAVELGEVPSAISLKLLPDLPLTAENLLDAVHRIEQQRILEELFWVHDLDGKFDLRTRSTDEVLGALRSDAAQNTPKGAVARHNLAVLLTSLARELPGTRRLAYWEEALLCWEQTLANEAFWQFMAGRAEATAAETTAAGIGDLRAEVKKIIEGVIADEVWSAFENKDYKAAGVLTQLAASHQGVFNVRAAIEAVSGRLINDRSVALGGVLDRVSALQRGADQNAVRRALSAAERDIQKISDDFAETSRTFGPAALAGWNDMRALAFEALSAAWHNLLDDFQEAIRLVVEGQKFASGAEIRARLESDWKYIQRALHCAEGFRLIQAKDYAGAERKFNGALALSTPEQQAEVMQFLESCSRARVFQDVDAAKCFPSLHTINGIGATFYGKRGFDPLTGTYVTNHWLVFFFFPVIPFASYRVAIAGGRSYRIYGRVPLSRLLKSYRWGVLAAVVLLFVYPIMNAVPPSPSPSSADGGNAAAVSPAPSASGTSISSLAARKPLRRSSSPPARAAAPVILAGRNPIIQWPSSPPAQPVAPVVLPVLPARSPGGNSGFDPARDAERQAIESERAELRRLRESLEARGTAVEKEGDALKKMESDMDSLRSSYSLPEVVRMRYNLMVQDYNIRAPEYNRSLVSLRTDRNVYQNRIAAFNGRVERFNASR